MTDYKSIITSSEPQSYQSFRQTERIVLQIAFSFVRLTFCLKITLQISGRDIILAAHLPAGEFKHHRRGWSSRSRDRSQRRRHRGGPRHQRLSLRRDDPLVRTHETEQPTMARPRAHDLNRNHRAAAGIITSRRVHAGTACSSGARRGRTARRW